MSDQFRELQHRGMGIKVYAKFFNDLALFTLRDVATNALSVGYFRRGLWDEIWLLCKYPRLLTYTELLNMAFGIEDDRVSIKRSTIVTDKFLG